DGFTAKLAIHPAQVQTINEVFTPSPAAIARARAVIAAFAEHPGAGVVGIGGIMYDRPHLERAKQLLARAEAAGLGGAGGLCFVMPSPGSNPGQALVPGSHDRWKAWIACTSQDNPAI